MQGLILVELEHFVREKYGAETWSVLLDRSGLSHRSFVTTETYPDSEVVRLVTTASAMTQTPVQELLEKYGEFIVPRLLELYRDSLKPGWKTLEVIANTEDAIHSVVRRQNPDADPPRILTLRLSRDEVTLAYASPRKLCAVARGIGRGIAKHFGEKLEIRGLQGRVVRTQEGHGVALDEGQDRADLFVVHCLVNRLLSTGKRMADTVVAGDAVHFLGFLALLEPVDIGLDVRRHGDLRA